MDYIESKINDKVSARIYYSRAGRQIYLVDENDEEIAEVRLLGLDFGDFYAILSSGGDVDE